MACLCHFHSRNERLSNSVGFPGASGGKESASNARDPGSMAVGKIPWKRKWQPTALFSLENSINRGVWQPTVCGVTKREDWEANSLVIIAKHLQKHQVGARSESFWFIFSVNIGENLFGICRLFPVSALGVSGVCVYLRWSTWSLIEPECGFALYVHEKEVHQKLNLAQIPSEWPGGQNNIFWYQRLFGD